MDRIEVFPGMTDILPFSIKGISGSRNNAMDVWVQGKVLSPGVQHSHDPAFYSIMCVSEGPKCIPYS